MLERGRAEGRAGVEVTSGGSTLPSTTMAALQRRQRIRTFLSRIRSSATAYLAGHCPHCTFMWAFQDAATNAEAAGTAGHCAAQPRTLDGKNPKSGAGSVWSSAASSGESSLIRREFL